MYYNVNLIKQVGPKDCWHACVKMLWAFKYNVDVDYLMKDDISFTRGLDPNPKTGTSKLVAKCGMQFIPRLSISAIKNYTLSNIKNLLRNYGPIFVSIGIQNDGYPYLGSGTAYAHAVIISGVSGDLIVIKDPNAVIDAITIDELKKCIIRTNMLFLLNGLDKRNSYSKMFENPL